MNNKQSKDKGKSRLAKKMKVGGHATKHGGYAYLMTGKLPEDRLHVLRYLTAVREGLVRDLGPTEDDLTTAQIIIIDRIVSKIGIIRCIEEHTRENTVMLGRELAPALHDSYLAYNNSVVRALEKLGIHKRVGDSVPDVQAYIEQFDEEKEKKKKVKAKREVKK